MTELNSILFYMLEDHKILDQKLDALLDGYGLDVKDMRHLFVDFSEHMEKHMRTEEQAIFSFSGYENPEIQNAIRELLVDHSQIRNLLKEMSEEIKTGFPKGFDGFVQLLRHHQNAETASLYPKLDRELAERQKNFIIEKIKAGR